MRKTVLILSASLLAFSAPSAIAETEETAPVQSMGEQRGAGSPSEGQMLEAISHQIMREVRRTIRQEMRRHMWPDPRLRERQAQNMAEQPSEGVKPTPTEHADRSDGILPSLLTARIPRLRGIALQTGFVLLDADGNGTISLDEAQAFTERMFNLLDTNDEGEVSIEEIETFLRGTQPDQ